MNWQTAVSRTYDRHWQKGINLALRLAREMAGAAGPADVMEKLQPAE